jgi:thiamine kinase-like enzyme
MRSILLIAICLLLQSSLPAQNRQEITSQLVSDLAGRPVERISLLTGGCSGAELFLAEVGEEKYVVRFITGQAVEKREREVAAFKSAFDLGIGPMLFYADAQAGIIVTEYLTSDSTTDGLYAALGKLARQIHSAPPLEHKASLFDTVNREKEGYLKSAKNVLSAQQMERIEQLLQAIQQAVENYPHKAPCHRDMHKHNLFFIKGKCLAIDFELAAEDDAFVDLAIMAVSYQLNSAQENELLSSYFERGPTLKEELKLYLMKQVVQIFWGFGSLNGVPSGAPELAHPLTSYAALADLDFDEKSPTPAQQLGNASLLFRTALDQFDSEKSQQALRLLRDCP